MSTSAQIAANRRNAQKSTGPSTIDGRNRTRLNALQHGITRQVTIMTEYERPAFMEYCAEIVRDLAPANAHERHLAQAIAEDYWRLDRSRAAEHNLFTLGLAENASDETRVLVDDPRAHAAFTQARVAIDHAEKLNLFSLYEQRLNRSLHKNHALLRQLQTERKAEERHALEHALDLVERGVEAPRVRAVAHDPNRQLNEMESLAVNGFVFSNSDLEHEIDRRDRYWNPRPNRRGPSKSLQSAA